MLFSNKDLRKLIIPLVFEQMLVMLVGLCDTVMVSQVGEAAVSGVSLVDMINQLIVAVLSALATGGAVISSQYIGHRDKKHACKTANQLLLVVLVTGFLLMTLVLLGNEYILSLVFGNIEPEVMRNAVVYFLISGLSYPFLAAYNAGGALFRSMGNSKITLEVSVLMNIVNVIFNGIFIFGFDMGAAGAALGSLIARAVAAVVINLLLRNPKLEIHYTAWEHPIFHMDTIKKILYIGIPNGIENGIFQFGRIIVVAIIAGFGTTQIAANAVANNFDGIGCIPGCAMQLAMITVVGQCVGARDYKQAEYYTKKLMKISFAAFAVWNGIILSTLHWTLQIYALSKETMQLAYLLIFIHDGIAIFLWSPSFVLPNALRAGNDVKFTMRVSIFSMFVFRVAMSYVLGVCFGMGAVGVWIAMVIDWTFRTIFFVWRFFSRKWQSVRLV
ncbi:MAG: MATE family efflux transporter [Lachnospiraceae bacterium]|nr:MATE family efflux transporter [Lachnospiraceae bacterium]